MNDCSTSAAHPATAADALKEMLPERVMLCCNSRRSSRSMSWEVCVRGANAGTLHIAPGRDGHEYLVVAHGGGAAAYEGTNAVDCLVAILRVADVCDAALHARLAFDSEPAENAFAMADAAMETDAHAQAVAAVEAALAHYELEGQVTDHLGSLGVDVSIVWLGAADSYGVRVQTTDAQDVSLSLVDANLCYLPRPNGRPFSLAWAVDAQLLHAVWQEELLLTAA